MASGQGGDDRCRGAVFGWGGKWGRGASRLGLGLGLGNEISVDYSLTFRVHDANHVPDAEDI